MTAGLPGAGIGGLFYLASTLALPVRSAWRRLRGRPDPVTLRQLVHSLTMALGIIGGLWLAGWLLGFVVPAEMLRPPAAGVAGGGLAARTVLPAATFVAGVATLSLVLVVVEVARLVVRRSSGARRVRAT